MQSIRPLTLHALTPLMADRLYEMAALQILDDEDADSGALINPSYAIADNKVTSGFIVLSVYFMLAEPESDLISIEQLEAAARYLLRAQRPSGNIDLHSVNPDSAPDTGFTVQQLCTLFELIRRSPDPRFDELLSLLEQFIRRAVPGICTGGFHTPNHRWVIVSALLQARDIFPDLDVDEAVDAYLAEGFDIDEEGAFLERSVGVYDAVNDRSLLFIHWLTGRRDALEAVERNLTFCLHLLHADGSAETGLSRRQDYGVRAVAAGLVQPLLGAHAERSNPEFAAAAAWLWSQNHANDHLLWTVYGLLRDGDPEIGTERPPNDYQRHYPRNGIWRLRRDKLSVSLFQDTTRLLSFVFGDAELTSMKVSLTYFGGLGGRFVADTMEADGEQVILHSEGMRRPRRPAYEMPLGRPVPPEEWRVAHRDRDLNRLPPAASTLEIEEIERGLRVRLVSKEALEGIALQIGFDFPPGGVWESEDVRTLPVAGQPLFLKRGRGCMRYGSDGICIGPGAGAHAMWPMREAEHSADHVPVLLTFHTPVDFTFTIQGFRGQRMPVKV